MSQRGQEIGRGGLDGWGGKVIVHLVFIGEPTDWGDLTHVGIVASWRGPCLTRKCGVHSLTEQIMKGWQTEDGRRHRRLRRRQSRWRRSGRTFIPIANAKRPRALDNLRNKRERSVARRKRG